MKFELQTLPRNCSNEEIIADIKRVDLIVNKDFLTQTDYEKYGKMSSAGIKKRLGDWKTILNLAGLEHKYAGKEISEKMRQQKAQHLTDEEVLDELKRVSKIFNENSITMADFDKNSEIAHGTFITRFGGWHNALKRAGLEHRYSGKIITEKMRGPRVKALSDNNIIQELQRIAKFLKKDTVTHEDIRNHSDIMSVGVVSRRFGSWNQAMEKAGLKVTYFRFSDEDCFENLLNVWTQHGRQPRYREMNIAPSKIGADTYASRFGNWHKALEAFVARMNQGDKEFEQVSKEEKVETVQPIIIDKIEIIKIRPDILSENRREIGLSLRYKVLSIGKFKCVRCGASPATDPTCKLHVDHILPFSKGGKTKLENLQILCEKCNLGKGNRHSE
jgi:hypothetical protein